MDMMKHHEASINGSTAPSTTDSSTASTAPPSTASATPIAI